MCRTKISKISHFLYPLYVVVDATNVISHPVSVIKQWTVPEAACLGVGMDPLCYHLEPGQYYNGWREERETVLDAIKDAVLLEELVIIEKDGEQYIRPQGFCQWAHECGLLTHDLAGPLRAMPMKPTAKDYIPDLDEMKARYTHYAQQRLFAEGLSHAERR
jgi:hypothetical protein